MLERIQTVRSMSASQSYGYLPCPVSIILTTRLTVDSPAANMDPAVPLRSSSCSSVSLSHVSISLSWLRMKDGVASPESCDDTPEPVRRIYDFIVASYPLVLYALDGIIVQLPYSGPPAVCNCSVMRAREPAWKVLHFKTRE